MYRAALAVLVAAIGLVAVSASAGGTPPPPTTADCSPGYYKTHEAVWCPEAGGITCGETFISCDTLVHLLSAEEGATLAQRTFAKECLDAYFGTAENSPCTDD